MKQNTKEKIGMGIGGFSGYAGGIAGALKAVGFYGSATGLGGPGIVSGLSYIGRKTMGGIIINSLASGIVATTAGVALTTTSGLYLGYKIVKYYNKRVEMKKFKEDILNNKI